MGSDLVPTINGVPVLLPGHDHPEFGSPGLHYHVDYRYVEGKPDQARVIWPDEGEDIRYEYHPKVREVYTIEMQAIRVLKMLTDKFAGCSHRCGVCPHKGLPVMDGLCVGHGLAFDSDGVVITDLKIGFEWTEQRFEVVNDKPHLYVFDVPKDVKPMQTVGSLLLFAGSRLIQTCELVAADFPLSFQDQIRLTLN